MKGADKAGMTGAPGGTAVLVYDGDCAFCERCAAWVRRHARREVEALPWQRMDLAEAGLEQAEVLSAAHWLDGGRRESGHRAVGAAIMACGGRWSLLGRFLMTRPVGWVAAPAYDMVARNRHRMPGGTAACKVREDR